MSVSVTLNLDVETAAYLNRIAADQGRTLADVATWIVTDDVRREQAIDAELVARLDHVVASAQEPSVEPRTGIDERAHREPVSA